MPNKSDNPLILKTKLFRPQVTDDVIERDELFQRLEKGRSVPLSLICAPAGYGKSTLISYWLEVQGHASAWVDLDADDNDVYHFLRYILAAVQSCYPSSCAGLTALMQVQAMESVDVLARTLNHDLAQLEEPLVLVLDDYHSVSNPEIHELISFQLTHAVPGLNLILSTRHDPSISLISLRAGNALCEIRQRDLVFSLSETTRFINKAKQSQFNESIVKKLHEVLEGWPVGLRLALLASGTQDELERFIDGAHQEGGLIWDYLTNVVMQGLSQETRFCLGRISLMDRFCSTLCNAICGQQCNAVGGNKISTCLKGLSSIGEGDRWASLCISLDRDGQWFRFHHLFQDVLRSWAMQHLDPSEIRSIHERAMQWFESQGLLEEAFSHALQLDDGIEAGQLIARNRQGLFNREEWHLITRWLNRLPVQVVENDPELLVLKVWCCNCLGRLEDMVHYAEMADALVAESERSKGNAEQLRGEIALFLSFREFLAGKGESALKYAESAMELIPEHFHVERGYGIVMNAVSLQMAGRLKEGRKLVSEALNFDNTKNPSYRGRLLMTLGYMEAISGDMRALRKTGEAMHRLGCEKQLQNTTGYGAWFAGLSYYQTNEMDHALEITEPICFKRIFTQGENLLRSVYIHSIALVASGKWSEAQGLMDCMVEKWLNEGNPCLIDRSRAMVAELALQAGRDQIAQNWLEAYEPGDSPVGHEVMMPELTAVKVQLRVESETSHSSARALLDKTEAFCRTTGNIRFLTEALAIRAVMLCRQGEEEQAVSILKEAVTLAKKGNLIRVFVDSGIELKPLLKRFRSDESFAGFIDEVVGAFPADADDTVHKMNGVRIVQDGSAGMAEALSIREMQVFEGLNRGLRYKEIAEELSIAPGTVKRHTLTVYGKLGVHSRREAVSKARSLGILPG